MELREGQDGAESGDIRGRQSPAQEREGGRRVRHIGRKGTPAKTLAEKDRSASAWMPLRKHLGFSLAFCLLTRGRANALGETG